MNLSFGAPLLLWGALLIGAPILIHLLNRRRYDVRPFAAMEFLRQAWVRRRRRMRLENLLLLVLRCLAVVLAACAMALPFVSSGSPLAILAQGSRNVVLIVDRSGSLQRVVPGGATLEEHVLEMARRRVSRLSDERGDAITLVTPGAAELLPVPIQASPSVLLSAIDDGLPVSGGTADMVAAVRLVKDRVRPVQRGHLDVEILTDLQELSWRADVGTLLKEILDDGGGSVRIVDVASDLPAASNLGLEQLAVVEPLHVAGETLTLTATLVNHGAVARRGVEATLTLDGGPPQRRVHDLEIPPRGRTPLSVRLRIDAPGPHHLTLSLPADELPFDDVRTLALQVADVVDVLLVDGESGVGTLDRATAWLELALDPRHEWSTDDDLRHSPFRTTVLDGRRLQQSLAELPRYDLVVLAGVGDVGPQTAAALTQAVEAGLPLLVFTGERVSAPLYESELGGLLPARLGEMRGDPSGSGEQDYVTLSLPEPPPPELALFSDPRLAMLLQVPVLAWHELLPAPGARVLASFADALGRTTPAIVSRPVGLGGVILVGTAADDSWSLLPRYAATWVPFVHELVGALVAPDLSRTNVPVGEAPTLVVEGRPSAARLELASGAMLDVGRLQLQPLGALGLKSLLSLAGTPLSEAGRWTLELSYGAEAREPVRVALAAQPDAREGDLRRIDASQLAERLAGVDFVLADRLEEEASVEARSGGDGNLFRALLWALLACLLAESALARGVGGRR